MRNPVRAGVTAVLTLVVASGGAAQNTLTGKEEFGLSERELVQRIEGVEALIASCMREHGFEYIAVDVRTVRRGMGADKSLPGLSERQFIARHGFGISTFYTGHAPQVAEGYNPGRIGLGDRNIRIYENLSPADRVAYNRALFGANNTMTFAVGLEIENFSQCGGCTRQAIAQIFEPHQLEPTYYNPNDALVNQDPRMIAALKEFADAIRAEGYDYNHPDEIEADIRNRLYTITKGLPIEALSPAARTALAQLQAYERALGPIAFELEDRIIDPVEERVERELYRRAPR